MTPVGHPWLGLQKFPFSDAGQVSDVLDVALEDTPPRHRECYPNTIGYAKTLRHSRATYSGAKLHG